MMRRKWDKVHVLLLPARFNSQIHKIFELNCDFDPMQPEGQQGTQPSRTRAEQGLEQLTLNEVQRLTQAALAPNASESTMLKEKWVRLIYESMFIGISFSIVGGCDCI
jgi:hypothetical protein